MNNKSDIIDVKKSYKEPSSKEKPRKVTKKKIIIFGTIAILFVVSVISSIAYIQARKEISYLKEPDAQVELQKQEIEALVARVRRHIVLPEDETPIVATIKDAETLSKEQPFYSGAKNGDKLLVYSNALKALIYDPDKDIILNVGPVQLQQPAETQQQTVEKNTETERENQLSIEVRNGSGVIGAAAKLKDEIGNNTAYTVIKAGDAIHTNYQKTLLVNFTDNSKNDMISKLAAAVGATVVTLLPDDEAPTPAEALIIIGSE